MKKNYIKPQLSQESIESTAVILGVSSNAKLKQSDTPKNAWEAR